MEYYKLNNGVEIPKVGFGTFLIPKEDISRSIAEAYEMGYRKFDTAWRYHNEKEIAKALKDNGINRQDVFITTKVNADAFYYFNYWYGKHSIFNIRNFRTVKNVIQESFENLDTDYIDLFLVHWPWPLMKKMYKELMRLYKEGRIRAIGVSNFLPPHLEYLNEFADVVPALNQFEISPLNGQFNLVKYCQDRGIQPEAMSTFSHFRSLEPRKEITENEDIRPIAEKYHKTIPQVVLRWLLQRNISIIPKTLQHQHMLENISLFDFSLTDDEMKLINSLDKGKFLNYKPYVAKRGLPSKYKKWEGFKTHIV